MLLRKYKQMQFVSQLLLEMSQKNNTPTNNTFDQMLHR